MDDAETDYFEATKAKCPQIRAYAVAALERFRRARESKSIAFTGIRSLAVASARARAPLISAVVVTFAGWLFQNLFGRRGIRLKQFAVFGSTDGSVAKAFQDFLLDYSNLIRRVYESDHARLRGIQLFFDDLKGGPSSEASSIEKGLAEGRDLDMKAALGLVAGQSFRFLRELPYRARLSISGTVRLLPGSARVTVTIHDLVTNAEFHLDANSAEVATLPTLGFIEEELLGQTVTLASPSRRAEDLRQVSGQLQALALVLACKIRLRESQAVRTELRPNRWETICLTAAALKVLRTLDSGTDDTAAIVALSHVVNDLDPLYRPAAFLLGYAHLARGDSANARRVLEPLCELLADASKRVGVELRQGWISGRPRLIGLAKKVPGVQKWIEYYRSALALAIGGDLLLAAEVWKQLQGSLDSGELGEGVRGMIIAAVHDKELVYAAAGLRTSGRFSTETARNLLGSLLDDHTISMFDKHLSTLRLLCLGASFGVEPDPSSDQLIDALEDGVLGTFFGNRISRLRHAFTNHQWNECSVIIEKLRWHTRDPSEYRFTALLDNSAIEGIQARVASWFVPALRRLREQRLAIRQPLYLEAEYHLALSELTSFEPQLLARARERAKLLRENRLPRSSLRGPERDLNLLTACIEVNALSALISQIGLGMEMNFTSLRGVELSENPRTELYLIKREWERLFRRALGVVQISPQVRAAVATALGLLDRDNRQYWLQQHPSQRLSFEPTPRELIYAEIHYYDESLDLHTTSTAHCYMAECLIELGMREAAMAHLKQALIIAPVHALAARISAQLRGA